MDDYFEQGGLPVSPESLEQLNTQSSQFLAEWSQKIKDVPLGETLEKVYYGILVPVVFSQTGMDISPILDHLRRLFKI